MRILFQISSNIHMHEDTGGHESVPCHQDGSTVDKSPAVSHTQPVTNTHTLPESLICLCVFIRINLSPCNAFRCSVLAGRWFYLQIPNTEKWNIIQSPDFFFLYVESVCLTSSVCKCVFVRLCPVPLPFPTHGLRFISSVKKRWLTRDVAVSGKWQFSRSTVSLPQRTFGNTQCFGVWCHCSYCRNALYY